MQQALLCCWEWLKATAMIIGTLLVMWWLDLYELPLVALRWALRFIGLL
jgi:hypothetical protein